jgi:rhodanese-related sulfurtransferase
MHKLLLITFLATAAAWAQGAPDNQATAREKAPAVRARTLSRADLDHLLAEPGKVLLIDVRRPDEISSNGGFPVYLSIQAGDLEKHLADIPKDRIIVTVSNHAGRAGRAADLLDSKGFKVAGAVGAETYESEGGKLLKVEVPKRPGAAEK